MPYRVSAGQVTHTLISSRALQLAPFGTPHHLMLLCFLATPKLVLRVELVNSPDTMSQRWPRWGSGVVRPALPFLLGWPDTENTPPERLIRQVTLR